jgi:hypothetical protein
LNHGPGSVCSGISFSMLPAPTRQHRPIRP